MPVEKADVLVVSWSAQFSISVKKNARVGKKKYR